MNLISQWYTPKDAARLSEVESARRMNEGSGLFASVTYLNGDTERRSFRELFDFASERHSGEVCVVANTDIYFDAVTAGLIPAMCRPNRLIALTRWETGSTPRMLGHLLNGLFFSGTQDAWAFIGGSLPPLDHGARLGVVGCDQIIAGWGAKSGCEVINPSLSIRTFHLHKEPNTHEGEPPEFGLYGYPELTTVAHKGGLVMCHDLPWATNENGEIDVEIVTTCRN